MRRETRRRPEEDGLDVKKMLYIVGSVLALAVIAFVITFLIYSNKLNQEEMLGQTNTEYLGTIVSEQTSSSQGKNVNEMQNSISNSVANETNTSTDTNTDTNTNTKIAVNTSSVVNKNTNSTTNKNTQSQNTKANKDTKKEETKPEKVPDPEFKMPVSGEIVKEFADNKLVYSSTLDVWATHNGIDIKADKTTVVKASADGKITSIKNDPRYGLTVIIEHVNGYKTIYSNLLSTEFVVEGETVKQGQSIGTVGNTASFEISDEPHLHFELLKENEQQDPELYIKK